MKRKFLLLGLTVLYLTLSSFFNITNAAVNKKPSDYNIGTSYALAVNSNKPAIVLVYADWCGYCKKFMPYFETFYKQYNTKYNFSMVNADTNKSLTNQLNVGGFPTVFIIDQKFNQKIHIPNEYYYDTNAMNARFNLYYKRRQEWLQNK